MQPIFSKIGAWKASRYGRFTASSDIPQAINPKRRLTDDELVERKLADLRKPLAQIHDEVEVNDDSVGAAADVGRAREGDLVSAVMDATQNHSLVIAKFCPALAATPDGVGDGFIVETKLKTNPLEAAEFGTAFAQGKFPDNATGRKYEAQLQAQMWVCGVERGIFVVHSNYGMEQGNPPFIHEFGVTAEWLDKFVSKALPLARRVEAAADVQGLEFRLIEGVDL